MSFKALLLHRANELGFAVEYADQLHSALEPLHSSLRMTMDMGIYFNKVTRCEAECDKHGLPAECSVLLWTVCASLRDQVKGSIAVDRITMTREQTVTETRIVPLAARGLGFGSLMERGAAPGAVVRLRKALKGQQRACLQMKNTATQQGVTLRAKEIALRANR